MSEKKKVATVAVVNVFIFDYADKNDVDKNWKTKKKKKRLKMATTDVAESSINQGGGGGEEVFASAVKFIYATPL